MNKTPSICFKIYYEDLLSFFKNSPRENINNICFKTDLTRHKKISNGRNKKLNKTKKSNNLEQKN